MIFELDFNSEEALYLQVYNQIVLEIARNNLKNGQSLPSVRRLADEIGVNMHTVNKAYSILRDEGYLQLDRRHGAVVAVEIERKDEELQSIVDELQLTIAKGICKGIGKEEMQKLVSNVYDMFEQ
ncbi:MAG: GntR family transcriptional regulator [Lachnospiraceae bacterium]